MPTYTYKCEVHGEFEEEHSITIKLDICPICQKEHSKNPRKVERLISGGNFILVGSGWARDNYS